MAESLDAYLDRVLVGGREKREVFIADYDPAWGERFAREEARIADALGSRARRIEHIGSTSVPGLAAKPIVDVLVVVDDLRDEASFLPALEGIGYVLRVWDPGVGVMLRTPERDVHIHVLPVGDGEVRRYLLFRDWLRRSAEDRDAYEALKRSLAERSWEDVNYYAKAKTGLIGEILRRAEVWAATDWSM